MPPEVATTNVKQADMAADEHTRAAKTSAEPPHYGLINALLAIERRIYWHGLVMQQRP